MIFYSDIKTIYYLLPLVGFLVGLFGTLVGGGGGFFFLPVLILLVGAPAQTAVITALAATLPICVVGSLGHYRKGNTNLKIGGQFVFTGIIGAFLGAAITKIITADQLKVGFGIYSMAIALNLVFSTWRKKRAETNGALRKNLSKPARLARSSFFGLFAGTITGTFGTSGTAPVLAGMFALRMPIKMVIGTSLIVVLTNTIFAVGAHFLLGAIDLTLVYFLTSGSLVGAAIGPIFLSRIKMEKSENNLRYLYAIVMVAIGILMIVA